MKRFLLVCLLIGGCASTEVPVYDLPEVSPGPTLSPKVAWEIVEGSSTGLKLLKWSIEIERPQYEKKLAVDVYAVDAKGDTLAEDTIVITAPSGATKMKVRGEVDLPAEIVPKIKDILAVIGDHKE